MLFGLQSIAEGVALPRERERLTTDFPRQGHYAFDPFETAKYPTPDLALDHIGDLAGRDVTKWLGMPIDTANLAQEK